LNPVRRDMNKTAKILIIFLIFDAIVVGGYLLYKSRSAAAREASAVVWKTIDLNYTPEDDVEAYIKNDAVAKGLLPVYVKNYGRNRKALGRFKGTNFAGAREGVLLAMNPGLEDWKLIGLKYKHESGREVQRTILYVEVKGAWKVADSGTLME
jgi:hypothetical protein